MSNKLVVGCSADSKMIVARNISVMELRVRELKEQLKRMRKNKIIR